MSSRDRFWTLCPSSHPVASSYQVTMGLKIRRSVLPPLSISFMSFTCTFCFLRPSTTDCFSAPNPCRPFAITPVSSWYSFDLDASLWFSPLTDSCSSRCHQVCNRPPFHHAPLVVFYIYLGASLPVFSPLTDLHSSRRPQSAITPLCIMPIPSQVVFCISLGASLLVSSVTDSH